MYGLPLSVFGVSSHLFFFPPGVPCPGVVAPGVACPGVDSQRRVLGVAPGVSLPLALPGVSSHWLADGVDYQKHTPS